MKIKKFEFKQIIKLHLIRSRVYENSAKKKDFGFLENGGLTQIMADFRKVLHIIFKYHQIGRQILFVGFPRKLELKINKLTNHVAVPANFDLQGILLNTNFKSLKVNKNNRYSFSKVSAKLLLPKLAKKTDLIVIFSSSKKESVIAESYIAKIPVVAFNGDSDVQHTWISNLYNVQGFGNNLFVTSNQNFFSMSLNFLFKVYNRKKLDTIKTGINKSVRSNIKTQKKRFL